MKLFCAMAIYYHKDTVQDYISFQLNVSMYNLGKEANIALRYRDI